METKTKITTTLMMLFSMSLLAQSGNTDDVYYSPQNDPYTTNDEGNKAPVSDEEYRTVYDTPPGSTERSTPDYSTTEQYVDENGDTYITNNYYDDDFAYDDYYDYSYTARIRRFHRPVYSYGYYDPYYTNSYWYSGNAYDYGTSLYVSYPFWGSGVSWWLGLGWLGFGWGYGYGAYGYGHHGYGHHGYGHHGWGHLGYGSHHSYGYGSYSSWYGYGYGHHGGYGYGAGYGGYGAGYWDGCNDGFYDGSYGYSDGYNSGYYNSLDGSSYYYGPRNAVSSNGATGGSYNNTVAGAYQAQYTPVTNWYAGVDAPSNVSSLPSAGAKPSNYGAGKTANVKKAQAATAPAKTGTYKPVNNGVKTAPGTYTTKPVKVSNSGVSGATKVNRPNSSTGTRAGTKPKAYSYEGPSKGYTRPTNTAKPAETKKYEYNRPKTYTRPTTTRPNTTTRPGTERPKSSGAGYDRPKTSKPTYSKPRQSSRPTYQKPSSTRPNQSAPSNRTPRYSTPKSKSPANYNKPRTSSPPRQNAKPARNYSRPNAAPTRNRSGGTVNRSGSHGSSRASATRASSPSRVSAPRSHAPSRVGAPRSSSSSRASAPRSSSSRSSGSRSGGSRGGSSRSGSRR
ncbi:MAG: hypothetical protein JKY52_08050 [Flavobacteriales bacterium]|nr:hypothetical protein [Flavobacteriales bacterium]